MTRSTARADTTQPIPEVPVVPEVPLQRHGTGPYPAVGRRRRWEPDDDASVPTAGGFTAPSATTGRSRPEHAVPDRRRRSRPAEPPAAATGGHRARTPDSSTGTAAAQRRGDTAAAQRRGDTAAAQRRGDTAQRPTTSTGRSPATRAGGSGTGQHAAQPPAATGSATTGGHRAQPPRSATGEFPARRPPTPDATGGHRAQPPRSATGEFPAARTEATPATARTGSHLTRPPSSSTGGHRAQPPRSATGEFRAARTEATPATARTGESPAVASRTPRHDSPTPALGLPRTPTPDVPPTARRATPATTARRARPGTDDVARRGTPPRPQIPAPRTPADTADTADTDTTGGADGAVVTVGCEPVLTASMPADGTAAGLDDHREVHGELRRVRRGELTDLVEAALIRGRGGAGFPVARKLAAARRARRAPEVVVNGAESEPASVKDRALLTRAPHLVLDGAQLIADEIGARGITVWVHDPAAADVLGRAIGERSDAVPVVVVRAPDGYLAGESSAALAHLGGAPAKPAFTLVPAAKQGPNGRAVVVNNVESTAAVAALVAHGLDQHRAAGTPDEPGTRLLTVHRGPGAPVLVEASTGIAVAEALAAVGAPGDVHAVLVGGYFGRWLHPGIALDAALSCAGMADVDGTLGAGVVLAPDPQGCLLIEVATVVAHLAAQSAGQCGPCRNGLPALARTLSAIVDGEADDAQVQRVHQLAATVTGRGACKHPDGVTMFAASAVDVLADEVTAHLDGGCGLPDRGWLPLPQAVS
jgi:NADH:ubiquinone oxidoreductase subunit F (NADH-binding)